MFRTRKKFKNDSDQFQFTYLFQVRQLVECLGQVPGAALNNVILNVFISFFELCFNQIDIFLTNYEGNCWPTEVIPGSE